MVPYYLYIYRYIYIYVPFILFNCTFWDSAPDGSPEWSSSYLVWFPWCFRHGAMDPCEGTLLRVNADRLTSEFTHFDLVLPVSIVKQWALPFLTFFCHVPLLKSSVWTFKPLPAVLKLRCTEQPETFAFLLTATDTLPHGHYIHAWLQASGMSFSCRCGHFGIWWSWKLELE